MSPNAETPLSGMYVPLITMFFMLRTGKTFWASPSRRISGEAALGSCSSPPWSSGQKRPGPPEFVLFPAHHVPERINFTLPADTLKARTRRTSKKYFDGFQLFRLKPFFLVRFCAVRYGATVSSIVIDGKRRMIGHAKAKSRALHGNFPLRALFTFPAKGV